MERLRANDEAIDELIPADDQRVKRKNAETHEQGRNENLRSDCVENGQRTTSEVSLTTRSDTKESKSDDDWVLPQVRPPRMTKRKQLPNSQGIESDIQLGPRSMGRDIDQQTSLEPRLQPDEKKAYNLEHKSGGTKQISR